MDAYTEDVLHEDTTTALSYDDEMTYEDQVAALPAEVPRSDPSLLARISANKVYLPPESVSKGKRKREDDIDEATDENDGGDIPALDGMRPNALYLRGSPITHLPTNNIFAYARHFSAEPVGLEWIDDSSCVLVFSSHAACRAALEAIRKMPEQVPDFDDCVLAKPVPVMLWPAEDRINKALGMAEGLEGALMVRIARTNDKKVRGAKNRSAFYQKHGMNAGKDPNAHAIGRVVENGDDSSRLRMKADDDDEKRRQLDEELDDFLRDGEDLTPSPPALPLPPSKSKMRSDNMTDDGLELISLPRRSLLERTSLRRAPPSDDEYGQTRSRRRQRGGRRRGEVKDDSLILPPSRRRKGESGLARAVRTERPQKTLQELDDELEAFLNEKD